MTNTPNIELVRKSDDTPDLDEITRELEQAQIDTDFYYQRTEHARHVWHSRWKGQWLDGRKHKNEEDDKEPFPWDGASDSRLRTVAGLIREHVTVAKFAFFGAKVQAKALRPFEEARESSKATRLLQWRIYNHMRRELLRELPLAWSWRFGYGVALLSIEWEQQRRLQYVDINMTDLEQIVQAQQGQQGGDIFTMLVDAVNDPDQTDNVAELLQTLSPILTTSKARSLVNDLRQLRYATIPIAYTYINKPRWTACRPCVDVLFPSETDDIQQARWISRREWISESELRDRIETENYDPKFVDEAIKHKGESLVYQWEAWRHYSNKSYRDLIELHHFYSRAITDGTPCIYKTIFQPLAKGGKQDKPLYASHTVFEYQHGEYPFVVMRRLHEDRPILKSIGIAEDAYTDEQDIKVQQDGLTDRTSIILKPPMIVPRSRVQSIKNTPLPGAIMGADRPGEVNWMPSPPFDETPVQVIQMVMQRLDRRYALFATGKDSVDPRLLAMRMKEVSNDVLMEIETALEQTFQLMQQYEVDDEVSKVVGDLARPFHVDQSEIQGKHTITATFDPSMVDEDYAKNKIAMITAAMPFKQEGKLFNMIMNIVDPDAADEIAQDQTSPEAMEREKNDELNAANMIMNGIEPPFPIMGNHQLRLQTLVGATIQSTNPEFQKRLSERKDSKEMLQNRIKAFVSNIQQFQQNPQIGRTLTTKTFQPQMAPDVKTLTQ